MVMKVKKNVTKTDYCTQNEASNGETSEKINDDCVDAGPRLLGQTLVESRSTSNHDIRQSPRLKRSSDEDISYNMNHPNRGHFVIFNHNFSGSKSREGTHKDVQLMRSAAKVLGFNEVKVFHDLTKKDLLQAAEKYAEKDHSHNDCFACAILTHGNSNDVLHAHDDTYQLKDITRLFSPNNCSTLAGKPKLFFIQACRGSKYDDGAKIDVVDGTIPVNDETTETVTIPLEADFLLAHSTCLDYCSHRNKQNGSVFMQKLQNAFLEFGSRMEVMQILTRVNRRVAREYESKHGKKQIPSVTTRLTGEVFFPVKKNVTLV